MDVKVTTTFNWSHNSVNCFYIIHILDLRLEKKKTKVSSLRVKSVTLYKRIIDVKWHFKD